MKAMILAAGRGTRMGSLTANRPKPLLPVQGTPLIEWHLQKLAAAGVKDVVINLAYRGEQIARALGDGSRWQLSIRYSTEPEPLETGGAIRHAQQLLGEAPFLLVNADVFSHIDYARILAHSLAEDALGHLLLVPNPDFKASGDFALSAEGKITAAERHPPGYTFAGVSLLRPALVTGYPDQRENFPLAEVFRHAMARNQLTGEVYTGLWSDVGTPERLREVDESPIIESSNR